MAKSKKDEDEVIVDVGGAISEFELFIEDNQKPIYVGVGSILAIVAIYFAYTLMYLAPLEKEASGEMWRAESYFEQDSIQKALEGDGNYYGFLDIIDEYGMTKAGNLANYYVGLCYVKLGEHEAAIDYLEAFESTDILVNSVAKGALGDSYTEVGEVDLAIAKYKEAAFDNENEFSSPIYMKKAALLHESVEDYDEALDLYKKIKTDYEKSAEARTIDKYIGRAEAMLE